MHVLTKIFIVLVSLLAVAIVPLVAVHATNEGTYKAKWVSERGAAAALANSYAAAKNEFTATDASQKAAISDLQAQLAAAKKDVDQRGAELRKVLADLASAKAMQSQINSNLEIMTRTGQANQTMVAGLVQEVKQLRADLVNVQRDNVELDRTLAEVQVQLEVADSARKALQEEIQRLTEEKTAVVAMVDIYRNMYGELPKGTIAVGATSDVVRVPADRDMAANVIAVDRSGETVLAEIDAGSRDGVKPGWTLMVDDNGRFVANLRIIRVDVNRSTGVVEREAASGNLVNAGQKARATRGE